MKKLQPTVVGIGGTLRAGSTSEQALRLALTMCEHRGARTLLFTGAALDLPMYDPAAGERSNSAIHLVTALSAADGIIVASPGYHGSLPGRIKNALDYAEDLSNDPRPYFSDRPIGLIACAAGWQATGTTLMALRAIAHALRAWPTPQGVLINSAENPFASDGMLTHEGCRQQLDTLAAQVFEFATRYGAAR